MEQIIVKGQTKDEIYSELLPQIKSLIEDESDLIANLANVTSALKQAFPSFSWVGFYLMKGRGACPWTVPGKTCVYED
jgi:L-methionine (R)-S-oxide reductase